MTITLILGKTTKSNDTFDVQDNSEPEIKHYSYWYHSKLDAQLPAGIVDHYVAHYYQLEVKVLDNKEKLWQLHPQDITLRTFILSMSQTYHNLASLDELDVFDTNNNQKHTLNQLIHLALKNGEAWQDWYQLSCNSATKKNSIYRFIPRPWQKH